YGCRCPDNGTAKPNGLGDSLHNRGACISRKLRPCETILGLRVRLDNIGDCSVCWSCKLHALKPLPRFAHLPYRTSWVSIRRWSGCNLGFPSRILPVSSWRYSDLVCSYFSTKRFSNGKKSWLNPQLPPEPSFASTADTRYK